MSNLEEVRGRNIFGGRMRDGDKVGSKSGENLEMNTLTCAGEGSSSHSLNKYLVSACSECCGAVQNKTV